MLTSCHKDEPINTESEKESIFATIESAADTKAELVPGSGISDPISVVWEENDELSVFVQIGEEIKNVKFVLENGAGETAGEFVKADGQISLADATYLSALYPYNADAEYDSDTKTIANLNAPANYTYSAGANIKAAAMAGVFKENSISFKNIGAIVKVSTNNIPDGYKTIVLGSENNAIAGDYKITFNYSGVPSTTVVDNASKNITCETGANNEIYLPIFAGTYNDMYLKAVNSSSEEMSLFATKSLSAARSKLYYTSVVLSSAASQEDLEEVITENTLATNINVDLAEEMNEVTIPPTAEKQAVTLTFTTDEQEITVAESTETNEAVQGNVNININTEDNTSTKNLSVNLPSSTVTVAGNTTYEKIIASTADNTLILDAGTTANLVVVKKGNIQVNKGAKLNKIDFGTDAGDATSVIVIVNGGEVSDDVMNTQNVTVMSKAEYDFRTALESGDSFTLTEDLTITGKAVNITKRASLYLNGYTLTYTGNDALFRISNATSLIVVGRTEGSKINTISSDPTETTLNGYIAVLTDGAEFDHSGGTYSVGTDAVFQLCEGCTLYLSSGVYEARADLTVNGNADFYNSDKSNTIKLVDGKGTVSMTSATFIGYDPSNTPFGNLVKAGYSSIYDESTDTYSVKRGIYNKTAFDKAVAVGTGWSEIILYTDIETEKLDLTNMTNTLVLNLNGHKITTSAAYGVQIAPSSESNNVIQIKNGEIVITKAGTSDEYAAGIKMENGDYTSTRLDFRDLKIKMANDDWAYAINVPAGVTNMDFYVGNSELEGAIAFQCWGDNNTIDFYKTKLICNYKTNANYGSSCAAFQNVDTNMAENNNVSFSSCEFLYTGTNSYNKEILAVKNGSETNQIKLYTCTFGEGVTSY